MKQLIRVFTVIGLTASALAQGTILFFNADISDGRGGVYQAPILRPAGTGDFTVGLFLISNVQTPVATTTFFGNTGFFATANEVEIPGFAPGTTPTLLVRVWQTAAGSFENASRFLRGESAPFTTLPLGGPNPPNPAIPSPDMRGFQGFSLLVPEPATGLLIMLGGAVFLFANRRGCGFFPGLQR
jgi:hypothetical protein